MIYHTRINLDGWQQAADRVYKYVKNNTPIMHGKAFWTILDRTKHKPCYDALDPIFQPLGFNLLRVSFLIVNEPEIDIHQDKDFIPGYPDRSARINIPIINCEKSETRFYSSINWNPITKTLPNGIKYTYHNLEDCKLESTVTVSEPTVLRVRELHNVTTTGSYPRIALTCAVDPDPIYLLEGNQDGS
jgi:hypothetical protein